MSTFVISTAHLPQRSFQIHQTAWRQPLQWLAGGWQDLRAAPVGLYQLDHALESAVRRGLS
ncbi:hypothetical protein [Rhabdochromatium marinum]|uniref:hypothetical protein n=1 Tax=Rhabdochromatium marinum TaxID=48729 RepID=UPI001905EF6E|nr:hypothetical protein [Rhabdochromatium marinum]